MPAAPARTGTVRRRGPSFTLPAVAAACLAMLGAAGPAFAAPSVSASVTDAILSAAEPSTDALWSADGGTSYEVRVGGADCTDGALIESGAYTPPGQVTSTVLASSLAEGPNTVRVCVTDAVPETGSAEVAVAKDTISPETTIDSGPAVLVNETDATFLFIDVPSSVPLRARGTCGLPARRPCRRPAQPHSRSPRRRPE